MKKVYIDLGSYDGDSIKDFIFDRKYSLDYNIYAFEPNPKFESAIKSLTLPNIIRFSNKAAWIKDEIREFAVDPTETPMGSTLMSGKEHIWSISPKIQVQCFDFSEWIKQFKDDYVIVKMDTEGAEFPVLQKMLDDGTISIIDELWVEFHQNKVREYTTQYKDELVGQIRAAGVELVEWH